MIYRDEVVALSSNDSEQGDRPSARQLTPREQSYHDYITGVLLFPSRVDLTDINIPHHKREADLVATIERLAGLEHIVSELNLRDSVSNDAIPERKSIVTFTHDRSVPET